MKGLLGSADGVGSVKTPEGLSPEGTRMFQNPSALNFGQYLLSKGGYISPSGGWESFGQQNWGPEDNMMYDQLEEQGYDLGDMADDYEEGNFWADEIGGILGKNPMHPYGAQNVTDLVKETNYPFSNVGQYGPGQAKKISQIAKELLSRR